MALPDIDPTPSYLVFGASGGIGESLCRRLASRGARLIIAGRNGEKLQMLADELHASAYPLDATRFEEVDACVEKAIESHGRLDGVANCIGSLLLKSAHATSEAEWLSTVAPNLTTAFAVVRSVSKAMMNGGGSIVLVSSAAARIGLANHEAIAAAKAGVIGLTPHFLFDVSGIDRMNYPEIWQCVGMIVGVYGIGYFIAAGDSRTHWPIVLVGLLGKIFGPIGFVAALLRGTFPPLFGLTILTNDLIWWIPFAMILWDAVKHRREDQRPCTAMRRQYVKESRINVPAEVVFRFHESPDALRNLIPPWEKMEVAESAGSLLPGSKVVLRGRLGLFPIRWVAVHTEYDPPHLFADRQESGPFAWWYHRHRFVDDGQGGTMLRDEVEYQAPLGLIGNWLGGWLIRRKLERMFAYRHDTTRRLIESGEWTGSDVRATMS